MDYVCFVKNKVVRFCKEYLESVEVNCFKITIVRPKNCFLQNLKFEILKFKQTGAEFAICFI